MLKLMIWVCHEQHHVVRQISQFARSIHNSSPISLASLCRLLCYPYVIILKRQVARPLNEESPALFLLGAFYDDVTNHSDMLALHCSWVGEQNGLRVAMAMKY